VSLHETMSSENDDDMDGGEDETPGTNVNIF
jgi:hypothetical protein